MAKLISVDNTDVFPIQQTLHDFEGKLFIKDFDDEDDPKVVYMLIQYKEDTFQLISLMSGNRYEDSRATCNVHDMSIFDGFVQLTGYVTLQG